MRIIPKNTKVSTEFFKGVTLADMVVGFIGVLITFLIAISSLPYRGYIALGFGFVLVFLLVRIDDESNYMFFFRIIKHFSYFRSYRKPGFEYPEPPVSEQIDEISDASEVMDENQEDVIAEPEVMSENQGEVIAEPEVMSENQEEVIAEPDEKADSEETLIEELDTATPVPSTDDTGDTLVLEKEETDGVHSELKEEGFEILDLNEVSVKKKKVKKPTDTYAGMKEKAPQSVLKKIMKSKKGES